MMCVILLLHNLLLETNHYFQAVRSVSLVALMREADHGTVSIVTRASLITADAIVIAVTWFRLRGHVKDVLTSTFAATISAAMLVDGKIVS